MGIIKIDKDKCIGCGLCASIAPKNFKMNSDFKSEVISQEIDKEAIIVEAIDSCPVQAISR